MKLLWLMCLLICDSNVRGHSKDLYIGSSSGGYYWRYFSTDHDTPSDALAGGVDFANNTIYIGQGLYTKLGILIPGQIDASKNVEFTHDTKIYKHYINNKILCATRPADFQWVKTKTGDSISSVVKNNMSLVNGGHEEDCLFTIGRVYNNKERKIGKIKVTPQNTFDAIYLARDEKVETEILFEVLVYNPSASRDEEGTDVVNINILS